MIPYTHAMHAALCRQAARSGTVPDAVHVQTKLGRQVVCARIVTAWDTSDGLEMWQLDLLGPIHGRISFPTARVLQCSHLDGRCTCASAFSEPRSGAGAPELATRACAGPGGVTC